MLDILIDLLVLFLTGKKRRKKTDEAETQSSMPPVERSDTPRTPAASGRPSFGPPVTHCSKCQTRLTYDAIHGEGKIWCRRCYKTDVLHIRD